MEDELFHGDVIIPQNDKSLGCPRLWVVLEVDKGELMDENGSGVDVEKPGLHQFGGCWYLNKTGTLLNPKSYGKVREGVPEMYKVICNLFELKTDEAKKMVRKLVE